jgi:hypothetical protein
MQKLRNEESEHGVCRAEAISPRGEGEGICLLGCTTKCIRSDYEILYISQIVHAAALRTVRTDSAI